jgi:hypothetical protein
MSHKQYQTHAKVMNVLIDVTINSWLRISSLDVFFPIPPLLMLSPALLPLSAPVFAWLRCLQERPKWVYPTWKPLSAG